jgi:hypothetical protein
MVDPRRDGGGVMRIGTMPVVGAALAQGQSPQAWVKPGATWDLDFVNGRAWIGKVPWRGLRYDLAGLLAQLTFSRASTATYFDAAGVLQTAASGELRFDHDPVTLAARGTLLEGQRTDVVLFRRDLTNAVWTKTDVTAAKDQTGIDGVGSSASSITATADGGTCLQAITLASSARFQTAYVKRLAGAGVIQMTMDGGSTWTTITVTGSWSRVAIPPQTLANPVVGFRIATSGDAIAVDIVQNENGSVATSPIATTTSAATRILETLTASIGAWFNPAEGTLYAEWAVPAFTSGASLRALQLGNAGNTERLIIAAQNSSNVVAVTVTASGSAVVDLGLGAPVPGQIEKVALAYKANAFAASRNGGTPQTDASGAVPGEMTTVSFGHQGGSNQPNGWLRRAAYRPTATYGADLQALAA